MELDKIREFYSRDQYAVKITGIEILKAEKGDVMCSLLLDKRHTNAYGFVMGGVLFTLADFTFAIVTNTEQPATVTQTASVQYHAAARDGQTLLSETICLHDGKKTCNWEIHIREKESGNLIASFLFTGYKTGQPGFKA